MSHCPTFRSPRRLFSCALAQSWGALPTLSFAVHKNRLPVFDSRLFEFRSEPALSDEGFGLISEVLGSFRDCILQCPSVDQCGGSPANVALITP
jgi:hypothetical protein